MAATYGYGSSGNTVKKIQNWLNQYGYNTGGDTLGSYGAGTQDAVNRLQKDYGLTANGAFDQSALDVLYGIRDGTAQKVQQHTPTVPDTGTAQKVQQHTPTAPDTGTATIPTVQQPEPQGNIPTVQAPTTTQPGATAPTVTPEQVLGQMMGGGTSIPTILESPYYGVTENTMAKLQELWKGYESSETVQNAINEYLKVKGQKPGAYQSKYDALIQDLYDQISNRKPFSYDVNGDALYDLYKDQYTMAGQQAMMDTMGQAAALTGGYGNSYASTAGNQAYQQFMTQLANKVPELAEIAYGRYMDEGEKLYNLYNMNVAADERDYGRYVNTYNWWQDDLDRAQQLMLHADAVDYDRWSNDRTYWTDRADTEYSHSWDQLLNTQDIMKWQAEMNNQNYWANKEFDFNADWTQKEFDNQNYWANKEFDFNADWTQKEFDNNNYWANKEFDYNSSWADKEFNAEQAAQDRSYAYDTAMGMLGSGVMPSESLLNSAGISVSDAQAIFRQLQAQAASKGSSGGGSSGNKNKEYKTPTEEMYVEALDLYNEGGEKGVYAFLDSAERRGYDAADLLDYVKKHGKNPSMFGWLD